MPALCRECSTPLAPDFDGSRCPECGSPRVLAHPELDTLSVAHLDADAFYANVEKRDDPSLADRPVIVGGRKRGVVMACCYVARLYGIRSAMPMFKALRACPEAVVIRPDMEKYRRIGREIRDRMLAATPIVEPLSVDEAFLDLGGTERLHHGPPALTLARLARRIEDELGLTVSIGLSFNKSLTKIASDLEKPRGFAVIGRAEAERFLADRPVALIWGVGQSLQRRLAADGITLIGHLLPIPEAELVARYGAIGRRLWAFARGRDERRVTPDAPAKSISSETTFDSDLADLSALRPVLWRLTEEVARRLRKAGLATGGITLKLKTTDFKIRTRSSQLPAPTQVAETLFRAADTLLDREADGTAFRLIGIGTHDLSDAETTDADDLFQNADETGWRRVEDAMEEVRAKLGRDAIVKGRTYGATKGGKGARRR